MQELTFLTTLTAQPPFAAKLPRLYKMVFVALYFFLTKSLSYKTLTNCSEAGKSPTSIDKRKEAEPSSMWA